MEANTCNICQTKRQGSHRSGDLFICTACMNNGRFLSMFKNRFGLLQMSLFDQQKKMRQVSEACLQKLKESASVNKAIFQLFINDRTRSLTENYLNFTDELLKEEPDMKRKLAQSLETILKKTQRSVTKVIIQEVRTLMDFISNLNQTYNNSVGLVEDMKTEFTEDIRLLELEDLNGRNEGMVFNAEEINEMVEIMNNKIDFFISKHFTLRRLLSEAGKIITYEIQA